MAKIIGYNHFPVNPLNEYSFKPTCKNDMDDLQIPFFKPFTTPFVSTETQTDDSRHSAKYRETHGFATLVCNLRTNCL